MMTEEETAFTVADAFSALFTVAVLAVVIISIRLGYKYWLKPRLLELREKFRTDTTVYIDTEDDEYD